MAFPNSPNLNDPWTEAGIDYKFDGIRWVLASSGSGLTIQERRIFNGMLAWAQSSGRLVPPTLFAFNGRSAILPGRAVSYLVTANGDQADNFTVTIDWQDGSPPQVIEARINGGWNPDLDPDQTQNGYFEVAHTLPVNHPLGEWQPSILLTNEWGDTGPIVANFQVMKEVSDYTFTYSSLLPGLAAPTKASMSDNDQTTTVFATQSWADGGKPWVMIDFGEVIVPDWITFRRSKAIPGTAYTTESPEYWMRQRTMEFGVDDGEGGITWTADDNFEASSSWQVRNNDIKSVQALTPCRYIRFGMASNFSLENHGTFGISFGDISFGHDDRSNESVV